MREILQRSKYLADDQKTSFRGAPLLWGDFVCTYLNGMLGTFKSTDLGTFDKKFLFSYF